MKEIFYLFRFSDLTTYEMKCGISLKDAIYEMSKFTNTSSEVFRKALEGKGFGSNDIDLVFLYNRLNPDHRIIDIYDVNAAIFPPRECEEGVNDV